MNDINEIVAIIESYGGHASVEDILKKYCMKYHMIFSKHYTATILETLKENPTKVEYREDSKEWIVSSCEHRKTDSSVVGNNGYYRAKYRESFKKWIVDIYNVNSGKVINDVDGYASDVFFIEKNCPELGFLEWFASEETLQQARGALLEVPGIINGKQKPEDRVSGYISRMRIFREYLIYIGIIEK